MRNLGETLFNFAADSLRRGVGRHPLRVLRLNLFQLAHQRIEIRIVQLRRIEDVIEVLVVADLLAQRLGFRQCR